MTTRKKTLLRRAFFSSFGFGKQNEPKPKHNFPPPPPPRPSRAIPPSLLFPNFSSAARARPLARPPLPLPRQRRTSACRRAQKGAAGRAESCSARHHRAAPVAARRRARAARGLCALLSRAPTAACPFAPFPHTHTPRGTPALLPRLVLSAAPRKIKKKQICGMANFLGRRTFLFLEPSPFFFSLPAPNANNSAHTTRERDAAISWIPRAARLAHRPPPPPPPFSRPPPHPPPPPPPRIPLCAQAPKRPARAPASCKPPPTRRRLSGHMPCSGPAHAADTNSFVLMSWTWLLPSFRSQRPLHSRFIESNRPTSPVCV